jgi:hypothetical protein
MFMLGMGVARGEVAPGVAEVFGDLFGTVAGSGEVALRGDEFVRQGGGSVFGVPRATRGPAHGVGEFAGVSGFAVAGNGHFVKGEAPMFNESVPFEELGREWVGRGRDEGEHPSRGAGSSGSRCCLLELAERVASVVGFDEYPVPVGLEERGTDVGVDDGRGCGDAGLEHVVGAPSASAGGSFLTIGNVSGEERGGSETVHEAISSVVVGSCRTGATGTGKGQCSIFPAQLDRRSPEEFLLDTLTKAWNSKRATGTNSSGHRAPYKENII